MRRTGYIFVDYAEDEGRELLQNRCTEYRIPEVLKFHCLLSVNYIKCGRITQKCNGQTDAEDGHAALMPRGSTVVSVHTRSQLRYGSLLT